MTPRETSALIKEYGRQEAEKQKNLARMIGFATACYSNGKDPWPIEESKQGKVITNNDDGFAAL